MAPGDEETVKRASALFDYAVRSAWARRFLEEPTHHLCIAYDEAEPAGLVSGVEVTHPDKGTEMFLYELAVDERFHKRGIGRALVEALASRAKERGCYGMWVLTEAGNEAALATYRSAGAADEDDEVMLTWRLDASDATLVEPEGQASEWDELP